MDSEDKRSRFILTYHFTFSRRIEPGQQQTFYQKFFYLIQQPLQWVVAKTTSFPFAEIGPNNRGLIWFNTESKNVMQCLTTVEFSEVHATMQVYFNALVGVCHAASGINPEEMSIQLSVLALP